MARDLIYICEICQTVLEEHHCKAICPNCGRTFDCSDLPLIAANARIQNNELYIRPGSDLKDFLPRSEPALPPSEEPE